MSTRRSLPALTPLVPVLPTLAHTQGRLGEGRHTIHLVVLGDSLVAGVGIADHRRTVTGGLARRLHLRHRRPVTWRVHAASGVDVSGVRALVPTARDDLAVATVVLISVGVNDVKAMCSARTFAGELAALLDDVTSAAPRARVLLLGIPPMGRVPTFRLTLRWSLGARARSLDKAGCTVVESRDRVTRIPLHATDLPSRTGFADGDFHPDAATQERLATKALVALEAAAAEARS